MGKNEYHDFSAWEKYVNEFRIAFLCFLLTCLQQLNYFPKTNCISLRRCAADSEYIYQSLQAVQFSWGLPIKIIIICAPLLCLRKLKLSTRFLIVSYDYRSAVYHHYQHLSIGLTFNSFGGVEKSFQECMFKWSCFDISVLLLCKRNAIVGGVFALSRLTMFTLLCHTHFVHLGCNYIVVSVSEHPRLAK